MPPCDALAPEACGAGKSTPDHPTMARTQPDETLAGDEAGAAPGSAILVAGNRLTVCTEGPAILRAMLDLIGGARRSLRLLYYIFSPDRSGETVRDALVAACERGVAVSLLIDDFGSDAGSGFFAPLREAGAEVCRFHPSLGRRYLLRNHQKLLLADEQTVLIGGFNVEDSYFGTPEEGAWRDLGLLVEGDAASRLAPYFDELFAWAGTERARMRTLRQLIKRYTETEGPLQWQLGGPTRKLSPWGQATCRDLGRATRLGMIAAYFSPTLGMRRRIGLVAARGRARVITAAKSDNTTTIAAARSTYGRLLRRGAELFEYERTKLHTKLMVLDDVVHVGSANFDIRSMFLNLELMLRVEDPAFAAAAWRYFEGECQDSTEITREVHTRRASLLNRIKWGMAFFMVTSMDYTVTRRLNFGVEE